MQITSIGISLHEILNESCFLKKKWENYFHYENKPIQTYWKFYHQKKWKFSDKNSDIFHYSAQNIDCGYSLEPPRRGGFNEYHASPRRF